MKQCIIDATPDGAEYLTRGGTMCFYRNITSKGYEYTYSKMTPWRSNRGRPKHKYFPITKVTTNEQ